MTQDIGLKEAERKVFRTRFDDGLWEIFIGTFAWYFVIALFLSRRLGDFWSSAILIPMMGIAAVLIWLVRRYVVTPRAGVVKFGPLSINRLVKFVFVMLVINIVAFILGVTAALRFEVTSGWIINGVFGLILLSFFTCAAYLLVFPRLYFYGLLFGLSPLVGEWLYIHWQVPHHGLPVTFGITGGIILLTGLVVFIRFLHDNPLPTLGNSTQEI
jgi:hypothetical protein